MSSVEAQITAVLQRSARALLVMHATPDGDSAGSALALGLALRQRGQAVDWVAWDGIPERLRFLPASGLVRGWDTIEASQYDVVVTLDCASPERLAAPDALWRSVPTVINIDHHPSNPHFGTINWVEAGVSSTGELVTRLFRHARWPVSQDQALCLYTAMSTDTLSFRQVNTTLDTLRHVAWLLSASRLSLADANQAIWDSRTPGELKLLGWSLTATEMSADGRAAWVGIPRQVMDRYQVDDAAVDTVVHHLLSVKGVDIAFLVREDAEPGRVKVSWRGKPPWDVGVLAARFGGGGHRYAAAAQRASGLEEAVAEVKAAVAEMLRE